MEPKVLRRVSVLIPAYRVTEYISATLNSVLGQTYGDFEIIVVNDGCPDAQRLEATLAPYREQIQYYSQSNGGPAAARNLAFSKARGELIGLVDGDDLWSPDFLQTQIELLEKESVDLVYSDLAVKDRTDTILGFQRPSGKVTFESLVTMRDVIPNSAVLARRASIEDAGAWHSPLRRCEDLDLWLRMASNGARMLCNPKVLGQYRYRSGSQSFSTIPMLQARLDVYRRISALPLTKDENAMIDKQLVLTQAWLDLDLGKVAIQKKQFREAIHHLTQANRTLNRRKISIALKISAVLPQALWFLHAGSNLRERLHERRLAATSTQPLQ